MIHNDGTLYRGHIPDNYCKIRHNRDGNADPGNIRILYIRKDDIRHNDPANDDLQNHQQKPSPIHLSQGKKPILHHDHALDIGGNNDGHNGDHTKNHSRKSDFGVGDNSGKADDGDGDDEYDGPRGDVDAPHARDGLAALLAGHAGQAIRSLDGGHQDGPPGDADLASTRQKDGADQDVKRAASAKRGGHYQDAGDDPQLSGDAPDDRRDPRPSLHSEFFLVIQNVFLAPYQRAHARPQLSLAELGQHC